MSRTSWLLYQIITINGKHDYRAVEGLSKSMQLTEKMDFFILV